MRIHINQPTTTESPNRDLSSGGNMVGDFFDYYLDTTVPSQFRAYIMMEIGRIVNCRTQKYFHVAQRINMYLEL